MIEHDGENTARYAEFFLRYKRAAELLTDVYHDLSSYAESPGLMSGSPCESTPGPESGSVSDVN
jgi:hypothetical protein